MADIVNLRTARKRKARAADAEVAAENRVKFGRTKAEKDLAKAKSDQAAKRLDGHKREE
ncbi:MAG TPA: DUF4169 family protein [Devosia sp.]|nr:DUF4169 family protein [Devosia sp.]